MSDTFDQEPVVDMSEETQKEQWIADATAALEAAGYEKDMSGACAHWASRWRDDFDARRGQGTDWTLEQLADMVGDAWGSSLGLSSDVPRYPSGMASLIAIDAARKAFCFSFVNEERGSELADRLISMSIAQNKARRLARR